MSGGEKKEDYVAGENLRCERGESNTEEGKVKAVFEV